MPILNLPANVVTGGVIQAIDVSGLYNLVNGGLDSVNLAANAVATANIQNNAVSVGKMKTASNAVGVQQAVGQNHSGAYIIPTWGSYGHIFAVYGSLSTTYGMVGGDTTAAPGDKAVTPFLFQGTSPTTNMWVAVQDATVTGTAVGSALGFYHLASPPWDLGDGEIPMFIFLLLDKDGNPKVYSVGQEPPWIGIPKPKVRPLNIPNIRESLDDDSKKAVLMSALDAPIIKPAPHRSHSEKNSAMSVIPHPFPYHPPDHTPVLIDPVGTMAERLLAVHQNCTYGSGDAIHELIFDGYLKLNMNPDLRRAGPPGVQIAELKFKNTR